MSNEIAKCTAFSGDRCIASGQLADIAPAVKAAMNSGGGPVLIFDDTSGRALDIDTRGTDQEVVERLVRTHPDYVEPQRGKGRPKLGVVAREVTLLPRHWDWLSSQPGGASVMLRKLVDEARRSDKTRVAQAREVAYRFMSAMAGNRAHFEEAARALFAGDKSRFDAMTRTWPKDIGHHLQALAAGAFVQKSDAAG